MTSVRLIGPLFSGITQHAVDLSIARIEDTVADRAVNMVHEQLGQVLQHPTGYYDSHIRTDRESRGQVVNDSGVIYGPWLEGVGSRNQTTSFKGYHTFREVSQRVNTEAITAAERFVLQALLES